MVKTQYEQHESPSPDEEMGLYERCGDLHSNYWKTAGYVALVSVGILLVDCSTAGMFSGY